MNAQAKKVNTDPTAGMTPHQRAAYYMEQAERADKLAAGIQKELEAIREANGKATEVKNVADTASGIKSTIWENAFAIARYIGENADIPKAERVQYFRDVMAEFLAAPMQPDGKPGKLTTAGQYASTAQKVLGTLVTEQGKSWDDLAGKPVADIRKMFRDETDRVLLDQLSEATKQARYVIKHGTKAEKAALVTQKIEQDGETVVVPGIFDTIANLYQPVKARKDAKSKAAQAAKELEANRQQHPSEATTVETVAANLEQQQDEETAPAKQAAAV